MEDYPRVQTATMTKSTLIMLNSNAIVLTHSATVTTLTFLGATVSVERDTCYLSPGNEGFVGLLSYIPAQSNTLFLFAKACCGIASKRPFAK